MRGFSSLDYYADLGLSKSASQDEIKRAYRKRTLNCHPDRFPGDKTKEEEFKKISEAYGIIGDPERRKEYDMVSGLIGSGVIPEGTINEFVEAFGKIINDARRDFENEHFKVPKQAQKKTSKRKESVKKDDGQFVTLKQGGVTFTVKRKNTG